MKMMNKRKTRQLGRRILSYVLVVAMVLGLIPESAYAAGAKQDDMAAQQDYLSQGFTITYQENNVWGNSVNAQIILKNNTDSAKSLWQLEMTYDGEIDNIWNADIVSSEQGKYVLGAKTYNSTISAGDSVCIGFISHGTEGKPNVPKSIAFLEEEEEKNTEQDKSKQDESKQEDDNTSEKYEIPEKWNGLKYALFTSGDGDMSFYTNTTKITGQVHTNQNFFYQGNSIKIDGKLEASKGITLKTSDAKDAIQVASKVEKAPKQEMPNITKEVSQYVKENGTTFDETKEFGSDAIVVDSPIFINGDARFHATSFLGKGIICATESIDYNIGSLTTPEDSRVFVASENGNITLNGSIINMNAVLYAPNGCVTINANEFHLNGRIIAKQVCINGTIIEINAGEHDLDMLDFLLKPEIDLEISGNQKENRKVSVSVKEILNTQYLIKEDTNWCITYNGKDASDLYAVDEEKSDAFYKELIFYQAGTYEITVTVTSGKGQASVTKEIVIVKDTAPVASFELENTYYSRNDEGKAVIKVGDTSVSTDGDEIGQRIWSIYYDEDNNGEYEKAEETIVSEENETEISFEADKVGKYKVALTVSETFSDTIPHLLPADAYRWDDTSDLEEIGCIFEVGNEAPSSKLSIEKSKSADIVFTVGDADKDSMNAYYAKAEKLKKILAENGIDARVDDVSTSVYTAQDSFAWKEYDHKNTDGLDNHIIYDDSSIKMVGYERKANKDFLYIESHNPGEKIFEFDLQKDGTDWHSMEGGGFLFNTTISEEKNTIQGFCVLVTEVGIKLNKIDCNNLNGFRNASYRCVSHAGDLLGLFKIDNLYEKHHFKVVVNKNSVSVWDGNKLVINDYVLPKNDFGYGYGPITSQVTHDCGQRSYFTFDNLVMRTSEGRSLSDIVNGYDWRPGASHYVLNLSNKEVPELANDESFADLSAALVHNQASFIGVGNETNENQYLSLLNATQMGGMYLSMDDISSKMDEANAYLLNSILAKDYSIADTITTDDIVAYDGYYQDVENDELYEQQWEYEYDPSIFTSSEGEAEHIVREEKKPITIFENTGAYSIRLAVRDNPVGENDALDEYRLWSDTEQYEKLLIVQSRPTATVNAEVAVDSKDKKKCIAKVTYDSEDPDHLDDSSKGIRDEYFAYKNITDAQWTEGKLPNSLEVGNTYLVMYQVKDIEGTWSFPAVAVVKTNELREYEPVNDQNPPEAFIDAEKTELKVGEQIRIEGYATDDFGVDQFEMYIDGEQVLDAFGRVVYTPSKKGNVTVKAIATDIGGNKGEKELTLNVVDDRDITPPTALITGPATGSELGFDVPIKGIAKDDTKFGSYTLSYKNRRETEYHVFKESTEPVDDDLLGTLDITAFKDGMYDILLTVKDAAENTSYYGITLHIEAGVTRNYVLSGELKDIKVDKEKKTIDVIGSVSAEGHMKKYVLSYQAEGSEEIIPIAEGTEELKDDTLGTIDASGLEDGIYHLLLTVEDDQGNAGTACGSFAFTQEKELEVDLNPPTAEITGIKLNENASAIDIKATIKDDKELAGYVLSYAEEGKEEFTELVRGTEPVEDILLTSLPTENLKDGKYVLRLQAWDAYENGRTFSLTFIYKKGKLQTGDESDIEVPEPVEKELAVNLSYSSAPIGTEIQVQVTLPKNISEENIRIMQGDKELAKGTKRTSFVADKAGTVTVTAIGVTDEGEEKQASTSCKIFNNADKKPPVAKITSPSIDQVLSEPVDIVGSAYDETELESWTLEYRMKGEKDYQLLNESTEEVKDGVLGHLDTTMLMNGQYEVKLTVHDMGGRTSYLQNDYVVEGNLKVGAMHIGFEDMKASMGGTSVAMNRIYDSRNKEQGDFGYGWTMGLSGMEVFESHALDDGYEMVKSGSLFSTGYEMKETVSHDVTITYGDGTSDRFELTFNPARQALVPISEVKVGYRCVTNQKIKLEIVGDTRAYVSDTELYFYDEDLGDPINYKLTTEDGVEIYLNKKKGVYKIVDKNDNEITVDKDGYHSKDGKSITFKRDDKNRIITATDPAGKEIQYGYDKNGDLTTVTDAADRTVTFAYDKKHNLMSITDPMGVAVSRNEYDDDGRLIATIDADGNRIEYDYDVEGRKQAVKDRRGNTTVYTYDDNGNILETIDAYGNKIKNTYDENNNLLSTKDKNGNTTSYAYDKSGNIILVTAADGTSVKSTYTQENCVSGISMMDKTVMAMKYDNKGRLSSLEDANGNETAYSYTKDGKLTGMTDEIGTVQTITYDADGNVATTANGAGESASYTYDKDGNCTSITISREENGKTLTFTSAYNYNEAGDIVQSVDNAGNITTYEYDANGNQTASVSANGSRITYEYDELGNTIKTTYPDGTSENFTYDANGNNITATDRSGLKVSMKYDKLDRMTEKEYADGTKETYKYDAVGNVSETISTSGAKTSYAYDNRNRNTSITDTFGNVTKFSYDESARLTAREDALGNITAYAYDDNGNITKTTYVDGNSVTSKYDARNRVISQKNQYGYETEYTYDGADRLTSVTDAYGNSYTYGYDGNGNLVTVTDAEEHVTTYTYDEVGRVSVVRNALGKTMEYTYDSVGNVTEFKDYAGTVTKYSYDKMNQLVKKTVGSDSTVYTYGKTGLLIEVTDASGSIQYEYDKYDRLSSKTDVNGIKVSYTYDKSGRLESFDNGFGKTKYEYDVLDRVTRVIDRNGQATVYEYDAVGNRSAVRYPNGTAMTYTYDACQRLKEECITGAKGKVLAKYTYGIGKAGERTSITEIDENGTETETTYKYDKLERLVKEIIERDGNKLTNEYTYDKVSNRIAKETTVKGDITVLADTNLDEIEIVEGKTTYVYNALNQLLSEQSAGRTITYTYDVKGNLIKQSGNKNIAYSYDKENHLLKATIQQGNSVTIESYTYDYEGNRTSKIINENNKTWYVTDSSSGLAQVVAEIDDKGKEIASYTLGEERISVERDSKICYYLFDGHGNVRGLADSKGTVSDTYSYDAYGNLLEKQGNTQNDFLYTGEQYNANTGLYYLRARYMNPSTGTFISMDSYQGSIYDPVSLHKYLYANANPVKYTDSSGYESMSEFEATTGGMLIISAAMMLSAQVALNIFSALRKNMVDTALELGFSVSITDWKDTILIFPNHNMEVKWIVTTVSALFFGKLFEAIYAVENETSSISGVPANTKNAEDYVEIFPEVDEKGPTIYESKTDEAAAKLGYRKIGERSHGQPVYKKGNRYITPDVDSHNGGAWKMADSVKNLGTKSSRMGTYDSNLNRIGD